jgi:2-polyprenyl-3-methyl-5-hydroxy-6-metoxy-1,4-benzoquinol methylase
MGLDYATVPLLQRSIGHFQTRNSLVDPVMFRRRIRDYLENRVQVPGQMSVLESQRTQSQKFTWGHDHDFGDFRLAGQMGTRHIWLLSRFFDHFGVGTDDVIGRNVLDVGCWTGGVSLILARIGGKVTAIDEVAMYPHALGFLAEAFGMTNLETCHKSLYDLDDPAFVGRFDIVFLLGVIYHVSDPIVALRRLFHVLKPGGMLCIETMAIPGDGSERSICEYEGPSRRRGLFGWNWFVPSPQALACWMEDAGFDNVRVGNGLTGFSVTGEGDPLGPNRCLGIGRKQPGHRISVSGLSTMMT